MPSIWKRHVTDKVTHTLIMTHTHLKRVNQFGIGVREALDIRHHRPNIRLTKPLPHIVVLRGGTRDRVRVLLVHRYLRGRKRVDWTRTHTRTCYYTHAHTHGVGALLVHRHLRARKRRRCVELMQVSSLPNIYKWFYLALNVYGLFYMAHMRHCR